MSKIAIFFGSTMGNTEELANSLAEALGISEDDVKNVSEASIEDMADYDVLLLGSSTWGCGDLQSDWEDIIENIQGDALAGKKVAIFGTGDSSSYADTFCNAMSAIANAATAAGATLIGNAVDASDYEYDESESVIDGKFVGLAIDEENEPEKTDERIAAWVKAIKEAL